jgi:tetratricopeptide (TPR) repeat protein
VQTLHWHATALLAEGELAASLKLLREAEKTAKAFGGPLAVYIASDMAEALGRLGRAGEAREAAMAARDEAPDEDPLAQASVLVADAFAAAASGEIGEARRYFTQALPILEQQGNKVDLGEARLRFARLLQWIADVRSAADQLERAREIFEDVGAAATLEEIEQELARLRDVELGTATGATAPLEPA